MPLNFKRLEAVLYFFPEPCSKNKISESQVTPPQIPFRLHIVALSCLTSNWAHAIHLIHSLLLSRLSTHAVWTSANQWPEFWDWLTSTGHFGQCEPTCCMCDCLQQPHKMAIEPHHSKCFGLSASRLRTLFSRKARRWAFWMADSCPNDSNCPDPQVPY